MYGEHLLDRPDDTARWGGDGNHSPVAVGETLRRLTSKTLLATVTKKLTSHLHPSKLGLWNPQMVVKPPSTASADG